MVVERLERHEVSAPPVFVDASGRRGRRMAWAGRGFAVMVIGYMVLLGAGMARAPWVPRVGLPGLGPLVPGNRSALPPLLPHARQTPRPIRTSSRSIAPGHPTSSTSPINGSPPVVTTLPGGRPSPAGQNRSTTSIPGVAPPGPASTTPTTTRPGPGRSTVPHRR